MKKILKYAVALTVGLFAFTSCEDPDTSETLPYYYRDNMCYIETAMNQKLSLFHLSMGLIGETDKEFPVKVKLKKAKTSDVTAVLELSSDCEYLTVADIQCPTTVTIPAGETEAIAALKVLNWEKIAAVNEAVEANITVTMTAVDNEFCAKEQNKFEAKITKEAFSTNNLLVNYEPVEGDWLTNRSSWDVSYSRNNGASWNATTDLTDDYYYSYVYTRPIFVRVDLKETKTITGFMTTSYPYSGSSYCPDYVTFKTSMDGQTWETQAEDVAITRTMNLYSRVPAPVSCRYIELDFNGNHYMVITEMQICAK